MNSAYNNADPDLYADCNFLLYIHWNSSLQIVPLSPVSRYACTSGDARVRCAHALTPLSSSSRASKRPKVGICINV